MRKILSTRLSATFFHIIAGVTICFTLATCFSSFQDRALMTKRAFLVDVRLSAEEGSSNRGIINDSDVTKVDVQAKNTSGTLIGSGSLIKYPNYWRGTISVTETCLASFIACAKNAGGTELYYGYSHIALIGDGDIITIPMSATIHVTGVSLDKTNISDFIGSNEQLHATVEPPNATHKETTWSSSDGSKVAVSASGCCTFVGIGSATVSVTTIDGAQTASCEVTVHGYDVGLSFTMSNPVYQAVTFSSSDISVVRGQTLTLSTTNADLIALPGWEWFVDNVEDSTQTTSTFHWDSTGRHPGQYLINVMVFSEGVQYSGSLRVTVTY